MAAMFLTLTAVTQKLEDFSTPLALASGESLLLRPLLPDNVGKLARFLAGLSPHSRRLSTFSGYGRATAQELCDAIARFDKLRLALVETSAPEHPSVGLFEFSFDLTAGDRERHQGHGCPLDPTTDCRFGPTLADAWQNRGVGTRLLPAIFALARGFGRRRIILWGGVLVDNRRAIRYYEKNGFRHVGRFVNDDGLACCDMILVLERKIGDADSHDLN